MARPPKRTRDRRSASVHFRCKPAELARLQQGAAEAGKSLSEYARSMVLKGQVVVRAYRTIDPETFDELRRIGVNLNQAVKRLHTEGKPPLALFRIAGTVERFLAENIEDGS